MLRECVTQGMATLQTLGGIMEVIGGLLVFVSLAAFVVGVVNIVKPQAWMKVRKRLVGAFIVLGSMGGCVAGATMLPPPPATDATAKPAAAAAQAAPAAKPEGMTQAEFNLVWSGVKARMERCDGPLRRAGEAVGTGDPYAAYQPVKIASDSCRQAWMDIGGVEIPKSAKGEVKTAMREAREICSSAALAKMDAMDKMAKVLDGDARPSAMSGLKEQLESGQALASGCWIKFMDAAQKAGLSLPEIDAAVAEADAQAKK